MNTNHAMKLTKYNVEKIMFSLNKDFDFKSPKRVNVKPIFDREVTKLDDDNYNVYLSVTFKELDQQAILPFYIDLAISGNFFLSKWEDQDKIVFARNSATAILFPYLRSLLTTITINANVPPYILPIMNTPVLFKDTVKK